MEKAAKEIATEVISVSPGESVNAVREEIRKVPSRLRRDAGSGLAGMYGAKFQALAKDKG